MHVIPWGHLVSISGRIGIIWGYMVHGVMQGLSGEYVGLTEYCPYPPGMDNPMEKHPAQSHGN